MDGALEITTLKTLCLKRTTCLASRRFEVRNELYKNFFRPLETSLYTKKSCGIDRVHPSLLSSAHSKYLAG